MKNLILGQGSGALCVPLTASDEASLEEALAVIAAAGFDLLEWRADLWRDGFLKEDGAVDKALVADLMKRIRASIGDRPLLFTYRTVSEGGNGSLLPEDVRRLLKEAAFTGADLVDVELALAGGEWASFAEELKKSGAKVIFSFHDFEKTPSEEEMLAVLLKMQEADADISKIALMPQSDEDVMKVLNVCQKMKHTYADRPYIVIAMGERGMPTRLCCTFTGSALTFVTAAGASAPGQVPADIMSGVRSLTGKD